MVVNSYLVIDGQPGPSTSQQDEVNLESFNFGASQPASVSHPATVQLGETSMGQVAGRLGVDENLLQQANPHIKNPDDLKAGQEIYLPTQQAPTEQGSGGTGAPAAHHHHQHHHQELPNAPLGSSIEAGMMKAKLDGISGKQGDD
ncbi:MAG TPA: LysM domain-containing protein [Terriglobales bacterium]|nr:LysM domain-containing protein [Terriglobales bacterium]